jgi:hypothetical protein
MRPRQRKPGGGLKRDDAEPDRGDTQCNRVEIKQQSRQHARRDPRRGNADNAVAIKRGDLLAAQRFEPWRSGFRESHAIFRSHLLIVPVIVSESLTAARQHETRFCKTRSPARRCVKSVETIFHSDV